jgi:hypothetical protein
VSKALAFLKNEFLKLLPPTIFFFVVFHTVVFVRSLIGAGSGFSMTTSTAATIGALILGKSILIADALPLFRWFRDPRLILNVVWRVFLYLAIVLGFQILGELIPLLSKYGGLSAAGEQLIEEIHWPRFWATHLLLAMFLAFYSVSTALIEIIGESRCLEIFLGWRKAPAGGTPKTSG